jgi:tRNA-intron endonuclease, archaea type
MKPAVGTLISSHVLVSLPKDIGRLYQKSQFGQPMSGNELRLNLIESAFLLEENKLIIYKDTKKIDFATLFALAIKQDESFENKYLVFREMRKRGIQTRDAHQDDFTFVCYRKDNESSEVISFFICVYSERQKPSLFQLRKLIQVAEQNHGFLWLGIVDEEGDVTYYETSIVTPKGENKNKKYKPSIGVFLSNRVLLFQEDTSTLLHRNEFYGRPFANGLQLSHVEALYLMKNDMLTCINLKDNQMLSKDEFKNRILQTQSDLDLRYKVYTDLKHNGLIVKTGFKFGTHFRAYMKEPFHSHAEFIIHAIDASYETQWSEISRAVRLAHAVNKTLLFALIDENENKPEYVSIGRLRP